MEGCWLNVLHWNEGAELLSCMRLWDFGDLQQKNTREGKSEKVDEEVEELWEVDEVKSWYPVASLRRP
jgi:hypothetical protein